MRFIRFIITEWRLILILLGLFGGIGVVIFVTVLAILTEWPTYEIRGPRLYEVERAISVRVGENKFTEFRHIRLGGAGAGGIGSPQIYAQSAVQFADLVPDGEPIYTWWEGLNGGWPKQVYWAFIENRAGLLIWETKYRPGQMRRSCEFQYMTESELVFTTVLTACGPTKGPGSWGSWVRIGEWKGSGE